MPTGNRGLNATGRRQGLCEEQKERERQRASKESELGREKNVAKRSGKETDIGGKIVAKKVAKRNERGLE